MDRVLKLYEDAVSAGDLEGLSDLTPLLGTLQLADQGVGLYLRYSKAAVMKAISSDVDEVGIVDEIGIVDGEDAKNNQKKNIMLQAQLAKIFNGSVTHLRHHLPMVAHALGGADGDVGLVQLVNVEVEKRAVALLRKFCKDRDLANLCARGEYVSTQIEGEYWPRRSI